MLGKKRLGMELHAFHRMLAVPHTHDLTVLGFSGHFQAVRQTRPHYRQRVIAGRGKRRGQAAKHAGSRMADPRGLSMNHPSRTPDFSPERLADRLVPEAHSQDRHPARKIANRAQRYARLAGGTRSGGYHDTTGPHRPDVGYCDLVVADHPDFGAKLTQILHEIPSEGIVVVDHQDHGSACAFMPPAAISAARRTARAFACVSCHSLSGTESATIPAPA